MKRNTVKLLVAWVVVALSAGTLLSQSFEEIKNYAQEKYLNPFAKDIGGALGGGMFHSAKNLGFPGFDVGIKLAVKNVNKEDLIVSTGAISVALLQAEIGLPKLNLDLIFRGMSYSGISIIGGGVKYTIFRQKMLLDLSIAGIAGYTAFKHEYIEVNTFSGNICASISPPIVTPYIGIGYDTTELLPGTKAKKDQPLLEGLKGKSDGMRLEAGINISPFPFVYLYGAYNIIYGDAGYTLGLGIKFSL